MTSVTKVGFYQQSDTLNLKNVRVSLCNMCPLLSINQ